MPQDFCQVTSEKLFLKNVNLIMLFPLKIPKKTELETSLLNFLGRFIRLHGLSSTYLTPSTVLHVTPLF